MKYHVEFTEEAKKKFKKMDKYSVAFILSWIRKNLESCENPRLHGKGLVSNRSGQWGYRVGDYRLITEIEDDKIIILSIAIGFIYEIYISL